MTGTRVREPAEGPGVVPIDTYEATVGGILVRRQRVGAQLLDENGIPYTGTRSLPVDVKGATLQGTFTTQPSIASTVNIPPGLLAADQEFTGEWEDVLAFASIQLAIFTDVPSAPNGGVLEFSANGIDVIRSIPTSILANVGAYFHTPPQARYMRLRYKNGATAQGVARTSVIYSYVTPSEVVQPFGASLSDLNLATIVRAGLAARIFSGPSTGAYAPLGTDGAGRLLVDTELSAAGPLGTEATLDLLRVQAAAINANTDAIEALLTVIRDEQFRRTDPLPTGTNVIGSVIDRLEARTLLNLPSAVRTTSGVAPVFATGDLSRAAVDVNVSAASGTLSPSLRVFLDRQGADGVWYPIWSPAAITAVGTLSTTVGQGMTIGQSLAASRRFRWEITGTAPSFTFSASVVGK